MLFLRAVAWPLLFGITPWILNRDRTYFPSWVPGWITRNWFEWTTYGHYVVAWSVLALALYARFEVFFPVIPTWQLLM